MTCLGCQSTLPATPSARLCDPCRALVVIPDRLLGRVTCGCGRPLQPSFRPTGRWVKSKGQKAPEYILCVPEADWEGTPITCRRCVKRREAS